MKLLIVLIFGSVTSSLGIGYYWRDYTGHIPDDAFVAGKDINGKNIYIGQAYLRDKGLMVTQINEDQPYVHLFLYLIVYVTYEHIKIFCAQQGEYYWLETSRSTYKKDIYDKQPIVGGHEDGQGIYYIGRLSTNKEQKIGKIILTLKGCQCHCFYYLNNKNQELESINFSVLVKK